MSNRFKYDIEVLINAVKVRPCLWDKSLEVYKDRLERRSAWEEIFTLLESEYQELPMEDQRSIGENILAKWTNLRDTFIKSLKNKGGRPRKKYIYYEHLKFLVKVVPNEEREYATELPTEEDEEEVSVEYVKNEIEESPEQPVRKKSRKSDLEWYLPSKKSGNKSNKTVDLDSNSATDIGFVECDEADSSKMNDPRLMNEDEAFFASLLPTVVKYNEDARLEFRIAVLSIMKQIKQKKGWRDD